MAKAVKASKFKSRLISALLFSAAVTSFGHFHQAKAQQAGAQQNGAQSQAQYQEQAQEAATNTATLPERNEPVSGEEMPAPQIDYYRSDNVTNQIPYFDNRFRIDAMLDEITLLFYRAPGSPPIILVRPDGTKIKVNQLDDDRIEWFDDRTFDMIKIKKPMPGPWQAIGQIVQGSHIMVMSDVKIEVEPLPEILLSGETLKVTGRLYNGDQAIDTPAFKEVVRLDVDFFSTNNSAFDNFGAEPIKLTTFRDDGRNLDEYANDSIFTGEFELTFAPGEWVPLYYIKLPMANRELRQKPVILHHNPISLAAETTIVEEEFHQLIINIDDEVVDPDSLVFQGNITFPDKQVEPFSVMEGEGKQRIYPVAYTEPGIHRVKIGAFGKTLSGREFRLVVPEFSFNVERRPDQMPVTIINDAGKEVVVPAAEAEIIAPKLTIEEELAILREEQLAKQEAEQKATLMFIGIANGVLILVVLIGFGVYWFLKKKKAKKEEK